MTIIDAMRDRALFGPWFSKRSWEGWRAYLAALFAVEMTPAQVALYRDCTGRTDPPTAAARESWVIAGRRAGKSRIAALVAVYLAAFRDYTAHLAPGEVATVAVLAADRRQARTIMRYVRALLTGVPMLRALVSGETQESIALDSRRVMIEVFSASMRLSRGYTLAAVIVDEVAFLRTDDSAEPDREIIAAMRPGLATIPGSLLLAISSPYSRRGALFDAFERHHGRDGDPVLVWRAPTRTMNPSIGEDIIAEAMASDATAARTEWLAEFRSDLEQLFTRDALAAVTVPGRLELPRVDGVRYFAHCDPSGGSSDSMTLAVCGLDQGRAVLACVREKKPPFKPDAVVAEFAEVLRSYGLRRVVADRYAGEWVRSAFAKEGTELHHSTLTTSELYAELVPAINGGHVELLDSARLTAQLAQLERRTGRSGKDSISHPPGAHDDLATSAAGAIVQARRALRHATRALPHGETRRSLWAGIGNAGERIRVGGWHIH